jgi:hypothetical protein
MYSESMGLHDSEVMDGGCIDRGDGGALGVLAAGCEGADTVLVHAGPSGSARLRRSAIEFMARLSRAPATRSSTACTLGCDCVSVFPCASCSAARTIVFGESVGEHRALAEAVLAQIGGSGRTVGARPSSPWPRDNHGQFRAPPPGACCDRGRGAWAGTRAPARPAAVMTP